MFFRLSGRHHKTTHAHLRYLNLAAKASRHSERGDLAGRSALLRRLDIQRHQETLAAAALADQLFGAQWFRRSLIDAERRSFQTWPKADLITSTGRAALPQKMMREFQS